MQTETALLEDVLDRAPSQIQFVEVPVSVRTDLGFDPRILARRAEFPALALDFERLVSADHVLLGDRIEAVDELLIF
jgi:hypothetical protein